MLLCYSGIICESDPGAIRCYLREKWEFAHTLRDGCSMGNSFS